MTKLEKPNINTEEYWDGFYSDSKDDIDLERFGVLGFVVKDGDKILDVGGGSGELLEFIGKDKKVHRTLFDISQTGIDKALKLGRAEEGKVGSIYELPYEDNSFDVVLCAETLEHLEHPEKAVQELIRVAKRHISISVPYGSCIQDPAHLWEYLPEDMVELLQPYGYLKVYTTSHGMIMVSHLEKKTPYIVDADDFCEDNHGLQDLTFIKSQVPNFKITLFTIPGRCSKKFINKIKKMDWIDMVPHGLYHPDPYECLNWTYEESKEYLKKIKSLGLTKGFKAPGWQISDGMYKALKEEGYWVADQYYNDSRRPEGLPAYKLEHESHYRKHYHIGHLGGHNTNAIRDRIQELLALDGEFTFIKDLPEVSKPWKQSDKPSKKRQPKKS